jgi:MFS family permease
MRRPLVGWLTAEAISIAGTRVSMVALPFLVLTSTGSPVRAGLVAVAELVPLVVLKVLGGPLIDRYGARRVAVTCDLGSLVVVGSVPLLHEAGVLPFGLLLALVAVAGALRGPGDAAKYALIPTLAALGDAPLERVTGLHSTVERGASMLGAVLAGGLVAAIGAADALVVDALSFGVSALVLLWALPRRVVSQTDTERDDAPYLRQLREGWHALRGDRLLVWITVMVAMTNMLDLAWTSVLVPVWGVERDSATAVGLLFGCFSAGAAVGSLLAATCASRLPRYATYLVCFAVTGLPRFALLASDAPLWGLLAGAVATGFAAGFINPILGAVMCERVPEHLLGRVSSISVAAGYALMPLGGLLGGALVATLGLRGALLASGAAYLVVTLLPAVDRTWRQLDQRPKSRGAIPGAAAREDVAAAH